MLLVTNKIKINPTVWVMVLVLSKPEPNWTAAIPNWTELLRDGKMSDIFQNNALITNRKFSKIMPCPFWLFWAQKTQIRYTSKHVPLGQDTHQRESCVYYSNIQTTLWNVRSQWLRLEPCSFIPINSLFGNFSLGTHKFFLIGVINWKPSTSGVCPESTKHCS